jgi:hypothetical protein
VAATRIQTQEDPRHHNRRIVKDARVVLAPEQCGAAAAAAAAARDSSSEERVPLPRLSINQLQFIICYRNASTCFMRPSRTSTLQWGFRQSLQQQQRPSGPA